MPQWVIRGGAGMEACWPTKRYRGRSPHPGFLNLRCWDASPWRVRLARPEDHTFFEPKDFSDLRNSAFGGIAEWHSFAEHVLGCARCGEV